MKKVTYNINSSSDLENLLFEIKFSSEKVFENAKLMMENFERGDERELIFSISGLQLFLKDLSRCERKLRMIEGDIPILLNKDDRIMNDFFSLTKGLRRFIALRFYETKLEKDGRTINDDAYELDWPVFIDIIDGKKKDFLYKNSSKMRKEFCLFIEENDLLLLD
jgi:hypothetical protein